MKTEIENIIYNYADEIPHILIRVINAITLSDNKEELRLAINKIGSSGIWSDKSIKYEKKPL